jgi:hypothetical protein
MRLMKTRISLKYLGPALEDGRMDVYQASENMIAFSNFMVAVVKCTYGDAVEARAEVAGYEHNCFVTDLVFSLGGPLSTVFSSFHPDQLWTVVQGSFALWKHLGGNPPTNVVHNGPEVTVTNNNGQIINVRAESFSLVMDLRGTEPVEKFVGKALNQEGVTTLRVEPRDGPNLAAIEVSREEAPFFKSVAASRVVADTTVRMSLVIVGPSFQDGNKWRFSDGGPSFPAALLDEDFVARVDSGERFGKGDVLEADLRIVQQRAGMKISVEREVLKVHRHITPQEQSGLWEAQ